MGYEQLKSIIQENREILLQEQEEELTECPYDDWPLDVNSKGHKSCPICGRIWS